MLRLTLEEIPDGILPAIELGQLDIEDNGSGSHTLGNFDAALLNRQGPDRGQGMTWKEYRNLVMEWRRQERGAWDLAATALLNIRLLSFHDVADLYEDDEPSEEKGEGK